MAQRESTEHGLLSVMPCLYPLQESLIVVPSHFAGPCMPATRAYISPSTSFLQSMRDHAEVINTPGPGLCRHLRWRESRHSALPAQQSEVAAAAMSAAEQETARWLLEVRHMRHRCHAADELGAALAAREERPAMTSVCCVLLTAPLALGLSCEDATCTVMTRVCLRTAYMPLLPRGHAAAADRVALSAVLYENSVAALGLSLAHCMVQSIFS